MPDLHHRSPQATAGYRVRPILAGAMICIFPFHESLADTVSDAFVAGSGFTAVGQIGTLIKPTCLALAFFWAVWGIISEARALGASDGDSASLGGAVIRGAFLPILVAALIATLV